MHIYPDVLHVYLTLAALSLVGGAVVMFICWIAKRNPPSEVWWMAISNSGLSICYITVPLLTTAAQTQPLICKGQAVALSFYSISTWSWYFLLSVRLYFISLEEEEQSWFLSRLLRPCWSHLYVWSISIFLSFIPLLTDEYGFIDIHCWVETPHSYALLITITPLMVYFSFIAYVCWSLMKKYPNKQLMVTSNSIIRRLIIWAMIFIFAWMWVLLQNLWDILAVNAPIPRIIQILSCLGAGSGFYNCLLWVQDLVWKWISNKQKAVSKLQTVTGSTEEGSWTVSGSNTEDSNLYKPVNFPYSTFECGES